MKLTAATRSRKCCRSSQPRRLDDLVLHHRHVRRRPAERGEAEAREEECDFAKALTARQHGGMGIVMRQRHPEFAAT